MRNVVQTFSSKTPICNQYGYRPAPVSNSKSMAFKIQMRRREMNSEQVKLDSDEKSYKSCSVNVAS